MNIREAKQEIKNTLRAYLRKNEAGMYEIPVERQRPVLLMGPPGIGKTAIMEQIAQELKINLISYTITHHTRQSAIGLPYIVKKEYGGRECSVTEYTMSEIVAAVYDRMEETGIREGILFLDEINCVSETLAPTMLQFLQYKTFGTHRLPEGILVVTAGNPPQYNRSVRDFDIVTLDRVRRINVEEDYGAWRAYAREAGIHGSILSYLEIKKQNFYSIRAEIEETCFVTARSWEDLSRILTVYEKEGIPIGEQVVGEYLQDPQIAEDFAVYYALYQKYRNSYRIPEILEGCVPENTEDIRNAPFDEKLSLIGLLTDSLHGEFVRYASEYEIAKSLYGILKNALQSPAPREVLAKERDRLSGELQTRLASRQISRAEEQTLRLLQKLVAGAERLGDEPAVKEWFSGREKKRQEEIRTADRHLTNSFTFLSRIYGENQELVMFLSELSADPYCVRFVEECGNDAYDRYNRLLLLKDRRQDLRNEILELI